MPPMKRLTGGRIAGLWATAKERSRGPFPPCCSLWTASKVMRTRVELREPMREPPPSDAAPANTRQLSLVSVEELSDIASRLGIAYIDPAWVAANIATEGALPNCRQAPSFAYHRAQASTSPRVGTESRSISPPIRTADVPRKSAGRCAVIRTPDLASGTRAPGMDWYQRPVPPLCLPPLGCGRQASRRGRHITQARMFRSARKGKKACSAVRRV